MATKKSEVISNLQNLAEALNDVFIKINNEEIKLRKTLVNNLTKEKNTKQEPDKAKAKIEAELIKITEKDVSINNGKPTEFDKFLKDNETKPIDELKKYKTIIEAKRIMLDVQKIVENLNKHLRNRSGNITPDAIKSYTNQFNELIDKLKQSPKITELLYKTKLLSHKFLNACNNEIQKLGNLDQTKKQKLIDAFSKLESTVNQQQQNIEESTEEKTKSEEVQQEVTENNVRELENMLEGACTVILEQQERDNKLQQANRELLQKESKLQSENRSLQIQIDGLKNDLRDLQVKYGNLENENENDRKKFTYELTNAEKNSGRRIEALEEEIQKHLDEINDLKNKLHQFDRGVLPAERIDLTQREHDLQIKEAQLKEKEENLAHRESDIDETAKEAAKITPLFEKAEQTLAAANTKLEDSTRDSRDIMRRTELEVQRAREEIQYERKGLEDEKKRLEEERRKLEQIAIDNLSKSDELAQKEREIQELEASLKSNKQPFVKTYVQSLADEFVEVDSDNKRLQEQSNLQNILAKEKEQAAYNEVDAIKTMLKQNEVRYDAELKERDNEFKVLTEEMQTTLNSEIKRIKDENLEEYEKQRMINEELTDKLNDSTKEDKRLTEENKRLTEENKRLKDENKAIQEQLNAEIGNLKLKITEIERAHKDETDKLRTELEHEQGVLFNTSAKRDLLNEKVNELNEENKKLLDIKEQHERELSELKASRDKQLTELRTENKTLKEQLAQIKNTMSDAENNYNQQNNQNQQKIINLEQQIKKLEAQLEKAKADLVAKEKANIAIPKPPPIPSFPIVPPPPVIPTKEQTKEKGFDSDKPEQAPEPNKSEQGIKARMFAPPHSQPNIDWAMIRATKVGEKSKEKRNLPHFILTKPGMQDLANKIKISFETKAKITLGPQNTLKTEYDSWAEEKRKTKNPDKIRDFDEWYKQKKAKEFIFKSVEVENDATNDIINVKIKNLSSNPVIKVESKPDNNEIELQMLSANPTDPEITVYFEFAREIAKRTGDWNIYFDDNVLKADRMKKIGETMGLMVHISPVKKRESDDKLIFETSEKQKPLGQGPSTTTPKKNP